MTERTKREKRIRRISLVVVFAMVIAFVLSLAAGATHFAIK